MKIKVLDEVTISVDPPNFRLYGCDNYMERYAQEIDGWARDFHDFIKDHRSQDPVKLNIYRHYKDICSFCKTEWEIDEDGLPMCCDEAQEEFLKSNVVEEKS